MFSLEHEHPFVNFWWDYTNHARLGHNGMARHVLKLPYVNDIKQKMEIAREALLWHRAVRVAAVIGFIVYPLHAVVDWITFHDMTAVHIRLITSVAAWLAFSLGFTRWGSRYRQVLIAAPFLIGYIGFEAIVAHEKAFDSVYEDALDSFFAFYCVLLPVKTYNAAIVGFSMVAISLGNSFFWGHKVPDIALIPFGWGLTLTIFLVCRQTANSLWEKEFEARDKLESTVKELRETEESLIQSERMAAIGRLIPEVAHELRTPLSTIRFTATHLERAAKALTEGLDAANKHVQTVLENVPLMVKGVKHASAVIDNLTQYGSMSGKQAEMTDINVVVDLAVSLIAIKAHNRNIVIHREYASLPYVLCKPHGVTQVLINVLDNACDAIVTTPGNIWIQTAAFDRIISVTVRDDGIGISTEVLPHVFDPFFTTKGDRRAGMGLGLHISRRIIGEEGGAISLDNASPGTMVTITLPIRSDR